MSFERTCRLVSCLVFSAALGIGAGALSAAEEGLSTAAAAAQRAAARMAALHQDDEPEPTAATEVEPRVAVSASSVTYGEGLEGYLARPKEAAENLPGLIVIHEWWGLNENIEAMTRRLAGEGYLALAVDLYGGRVAEDRESAMEYMREAMTDPSVGEENLRQAFAYLDQQGSEKVGVVGWCFGGGWSLQTALLLGDDLDAAVIYYGRLVTDEEELAKISAPILGIFGALDRGIPVDTVKTFEEAMKELGKSVEVHVYDGADHAFANPSGERYKADAAEDAWQRTVAFFAEHLR